MVAESLKCLHRDARGGPCLWQRRMNSSEECAKDGCLFRSGVEGKAPCGAEGLRHHPMGLRVNKIALEQGEEEEGPSRDRQQSSRRRKEAQRNVSNRGQVASEKQRKVPGGRRQHRLGCGEDSRGFSVSVLVTEPPAILCRCISSILEACTP